jgi:N6-L-threonylcarbamoyladenine synthase
MPGFRIEPADRIKTLPPYLFAAIDEMKHKAIARGVERSHEDPEAAAEIAAERSGRVYYPRPEFCTDNAAMIAYAGCQRLMAGERTGLEIDAVARWPLDELQPVTRENA